MPPPIHRQPDAMWKPDPNAVLLILGIESFGLCMAINPENPAEQTTALRVDLVVATPDDLETPEVKHLVIHPDDVDSLLGAIHAAKRFRSAQHN